MLKVQILDRCSYCKGKAQLPIGQADNWKGEIHTVYGNCPICEGTGESGRWISNPPTNLALRLSLVANGCLRRREM